MKNKIISSFAVAVICASTIFAPAINAEEVASSSETKSARAQESFSNVSNSYVTAKISGSCSSSLHRSSGNSSTIGVKHWINSQSYHSHNMVDYSTFTIYGDCGDSLDAGHWTSTDPNVDRMSGWVSLEA